MTGYEKYSDRDLLESYTSYVDYANPVDPRLLEEMENRGGLETIRKRVAEENRIPNEERISVRHSLKKNYLCSGFNHCNHPVRGAHRTLHNNGYFFYIHL
jgi:hypothetical protein